MIPYLLTYSDWGILVLRMAVGVILLAHGVSKMKNIRSTADWMSSMFKPGIFWAVLVTVLEVFGGVGIIIGFLTQVIAAFVVIQFIVIILRINGKKGLVGGYEFDLIILASAITLLTLGSGAMSIDHALGLLLY